MIPEIDRDRHTKENGPSLGEAEAASWGLSPPWAGDDVDWTRQSSEGSTGHTHSYVSFVRDRETAAGWAIGLSGPAAARAADGGTRPNSARSNRRAHHRRPSGRSRQFGLGLEPVPSRLDLVAEFADRALFVVEHSNRRTGPDPVVVDDTVGARSLSNLMRCKIAV
jgi:hypothetical protein